jgi:Zn-dependent protease with chaperone function
MSSLFIVLPLAAVFALVASVGAAVLALVERVFPSLRPRILRSSTARAGVVFAPVILAALGCVALAFPNPFLGCHCAEHGLHHPHLCIIHPGFAQPLAVPAACLVALWLVFVSVRLVRLGGEVVASSRWLRGQRSVPVEQLDGVAFRRIDSGSRSAFTIGALSPMIVVDRLLFDALSGEERRAVLLHEQAHVQRRDGLTLLAVRACLSLYPIHAGRLLLREWRAAAEGACDRHAASILCDPGAVASALVAVERARSPGIDDDAPALALGARGDLERRVTALLDGAPEAAPDRLLGNDVLAIALISVGAGVLTLVWPGGAFHHAVETLIGWFVH